MEDRIGDWATIKRAAKDTGLPERIIRQMVKDGGVAINFKVGSEYKTFVDLRAVCLMAKHYLEGGGL